jgi:hypothetical protein
VDRRIHPTRRFGPTAGVGESGGVTLGSPWTPGVSRSIAFGAGSGRTGQKISGPVAVRRLLGKPSGPAMDESNCGFSAQTSAAEALAIWRARRDPAATIALCNWIAGYQGHETSRLAWFTPTALRAIGRDAVRRHPQRVGVLVAVGRMLLLAGELSLALETLVRAATTDPNEPIVFRLLGEVLFRSGDTVRAHRMLERAVAGGLTDPETFALLDRARMRSGAPPSGVRTRSGMRLVAAAEWTDARKTGGG